MAFADEAKAVWHNVNEIIAFVVGEVEKDDGEDNSEADLDTKYDHLEVGEPSTMQVNADSLESMSK